MRTRGSVWLIVLASCVVLAADDRPAGPRIRDVLIHPSASRKLVALEVQVAGVREPGSVQLVARMLDEKGAEEKCFTAEARVEAKDVQILKIAWPWQDPRLWDIGRPNLYTLKLTAKGAGLDDEAALRFGFVAEALLRECCAAYLGRRAYELEPACYCSLRPGDRRPGNAPGVPTGGGPLLEIGPMIMDPTGRATLAADAPTRAWLCGPPECPMAKDHSFLVGQKVVKQVALVNETGQAQPYSFSWKVPWAEDRDLRSVTGSGRIEPGRTLFVPVEVELPAAIPADKFPGEIRLSATVGEGRFEETFAFRIFRKPPPGGRVVAVVDPLGQTTEFLKLLGYMTEPWRGPGQGPLVVIGRNALVRDSRVLGRVEEYVRQGGRALIFAQDPDWLEKQAGFRVAKHLCRRVFPVDPKHPILRGIDDEDLRDWAGESRLVDPDGLRPTADGLRLRDARRGVVCSAPIEKPHRSSWRPILECEFDLAYSPLMELDYGKGRLILCTLDLEDHAALDPAALWMGRKVMVYAETAPLHPRAERVAYAGDESGEATLRALGVVYDKPAGQHQVPDLWVLGPGPSLNRQAIEPRLNDGLRVMFLARKQPNGGLGVGLELMKGFGGSLAAPDWPEARGLSPSDLRWRADAEAWLVKSGAEVGASGLLGRRAIGKGVALFCQIDPEALDADHKAYFRYTRCRQSRAMAQILANLGASFKSDSRIFHPGEKAAEPFYHPDYRGDLDLGDDPYRYFRW